MPRPVWDNLDCFLQEDDFATTAKIILQNGHEMSCPGIFDSPYLNAQLGEYEMDQIAPRFLCAATYVASVARGDRLTIDGRSYHVLRVEPEGTGMAVVSLGQSP